MDKGAYEIIKMLIQCTDQQIEIELIDGTTRTLYVYPDKLLAELDKDQKLEAEAYWLARRLAEFCDPDHDDQCCVLCRKNCDGVDYEDWREAARRAAGMTNKEDK